MRRRFESRGIVHTYSSRRFRLLRGYGPTPTERRRKPQGELQQVAPRVYQDVCWFTLSKHSESETLSLKEAANVVAHIKAVKCKTRFPLCTLDYLRFSRFDAFPWAVKWSFWCCSLTDSFSCREFMRRGFSLPPAGIQMISLPAPTECFSELLLFVSDGVWTQTKQIVMKRFCVWGFCIIPF